MSDLLHIYNESMKSIRNFLTEGLEEPFTWLSEVLDESQRQLCLVPAPAARPPPPPPPEPLLSLSNGGGDDTVCVGDGAASPAHAPAAASEFHQLQLQTPSVKRRRKQLEDEVAKRQKIRQQMDSSLLLEAARSTRSARNAAKIASLRTRQHMAQQTHSKLRRPRSSMLRFQRELEASAVASSTMIEPAASPARLARTSSAVVVLDNILVPPQPRAKKKRTARAKPRPSQRLSRRLALCGVSSCSDTDDVDSGVICEKPAKLAADVAECTAGDTAGASRDATDTTIAQPEADEADTAGGAVSGATVRRSRSSVQRTTRSSAGCSGGDSGETPRDKQLVVKEEAVSILLAASTAAAAAAAEPPETLGKKDRKQQDQQQQRAVVASGEDGCALPVAVARTEPLRRSRRVTRSLAADVTRRSVSADCQPLAAAERAGTTTAAAGGGAAAAAGGAAAASGGGGGGATTDSERRLTHTVTSPVRVTDEQCDAASCAIATDVTARPVTARRSDGGSGGGGRRSGRTRVATADAAAAAAVSSTADTHATGVAGRRSGRQSNPDMASVSAASNRRMTRIVTPTDTVTVPVIQTPSPPPSKQHEPSPLAAGAAVSSCSDRQAESVAQCEVTANGAASHNDHSDHDANLTDDEWEDENRCSPAVGGRGSSCATVSSSASVSAKQVATPISARPKRTTRLLGSASKARVASNIVCGVEGGSFLTRPNAPRAVGHEELEQRKREELLRKREKEDEACKKREELIKQRAEADRLKREERQRRALEARQRQEQQQQAALQRRQAEREERQGCAQLAAEQRRREEQLRRQRQLLERQRELEERRRQEEAEKAARRKRQEELELRKQRLEAARKLKEETQRAKILQQQQQLLAEVKKNVEPLKAPLNVTRTIEAATPSPGLAQTSSYDMTPRFEQLSPQPLLNPDNYNIDDIKSDDDTDDDSRPKKVVPRWAQSTALHAALMVQNCSEQNILKIFDPEALFPPIRLEKIFTVVRKNFQKRTSSANWDTPPSRRRV